MRAAPGCNVYLVGDERKFLIDAGTNAAIIARQVRELDGILITHAADALCSVL